MKFFNKEYELFRLQQIRCFFPYLLISGLFCVLIGLLFVNVNYILFGDMYTGSLFFKILSFILGISITFPFDVHKIYRNLSYDDFLVSLDMNFSKSKTSPFLESYTDNQELVWKGYINEYINDFRKSYVTRYKQLIIKLVSLFRAL